ncbi:hypothetical protein MESS4_250007 [Mesorhizobium sp. STM 4661]|nr:hypothetical protein MESS4_250007 [Mesorhizobium sp. STM 4661]
MQTCRKALPVGKFIRSAMSRCPCGHGVARGCGSWKSGVAGARRRFSNAKPVSNATLRNTLNLEGHRECNASHCVGGVDETGGYWGKVKLEMGVGMELLAATCLADKALLRLALPLPGQLG